MKEISIQSVQNSITVAQYLNSAFQSQDYWNNRRITENEESVKNEIIEENGHQKTNDEFAMIRSISRANET